MSLFAFKPKPAEVISHWYSLVPGFTYSAQEFYAAIEQELKTRQVPGLTMERVEFSEGGVLSEKRTYLRMTRERLVFDICAAPFGTSYFFSCRFAELPVAVKLWQLLALLVILSVVAALLFNYVGFFFGCFVLVMALVVMIYVFSNAVGMGLQDLDATLVKSPLFGPIYERFFRKETYYREDTRLMYCDLVNAVVKSEVEDVTGAKGIKLVTFNEYSPILGELYKRTTVLLPRSKPGTNPTPNVPS